MILNYWDFWIIGVWISEVLLYIDMFSWWLEKKKKKKKKKKKMITRQGKSAKLKYQQCTIQRSLDRAFLYNMQQTVQN